MEQTLTVQPRKMKGKVAVIILTAAALVLRIIGYLVTVVSTILSPFSDVLDYIITCIINGKTISQSAIEHRIEMLFEHEVINIGDILSSLFSVTFYAFLDVLPYALIILYVAFFYKKSKATALVPVAFGLLCLKYIISFAHTCSIYMEYIFSDIADGHGDIFGNIIGYAIYLIITAVFAAPFVIIFVLLIISALKGFTNKPLAIVPSAVGIASCVLTAPLVLFSVLPMIIMMFTDSVHISYGLVLTSVLNSIPTSINTVAFISFFVAIIIFAAKNYIPEIIPMSDAKLERLIATKPKKALAILTVRYESGKLSEEEYNARVAEISPEE